MYGETDRALKYRGNPGGVPKVRGESEEDNDCKGDPDVWGDTLHSSE